MKKIIGLIMMLFIATMFNNNVKAAEFCVSTASELRSALITAENNSSFDTIKLTTGTYLTAGAAFTFTDLSGNGLELSGGWVDMPMAPCGARLGTTDMFSTTLDANQTSAVMSVYLSDDAPFKVSGLAFINGLSSDVAGLEVRKFDADDVYEGLYVIENNVFVNNQGSGLTSALQLKGADRMDIRNNLFTENLDSFYVVLVDTNLGADYYFHNNTLVDNDGRVRFQNNVSNQLLVANNVFRDNLNIDLTVFGEGSWYLYNNNISSMFVSTMPIQSGNFNLPTRFEEGTYNFMPAVNSPMVDAGRNPCGMFCPFPTPFVNDWDLGDYALGGDDRTQSASPDIGAFESSHASDLIFWNTFE